MPLKGSKMPYNRFYTSHRVEIPPTGTTPLKTPLNALCEVLPILRWRKRRRRLCVVSYNPKENHPYSVLQEKGWWQQGSAKRQRHFLLKHLIYSANYFLYLLCCFIFNCDTKINLVFLHFHSKCFHRLYLLFKFHCKAV